MTAKRAIELEVEVPGTPEEVWEAIATGPGIGSWFVPASVAEREGGVIEMHFGEGMDTRGRVTAYDRPRRFAYVAEEGGEGGLAYEWLVEARDGGTCVVRLINSGFGSGADWDTQHAMMTRGWKLFLHNLLLYRTRFPGQPSAAVIVNGAFTGDPAEGWPALRGALGLREPEVGERLATGGEAPALAGTVDRVDDGMVTLVLDEPGPGVAFFAAERADEAVYTSAYLYFHGDQAKVLAERERGAWQAWMQRSFPSPAQSPA